MEKKLMTKEEILNTYFTPTAVLLAMGKIARRCKDYNGSDPRTVKVVPSEIITHGDKWLNFHDYADSDAQKKIREILFLLQKHGYVKSELLTCKHDYYADFKKRFWSLTDKGLRKLMEIAKSARQ